MCDNFVLRFSWFKNWLVSKQFKDVFLRLFSFHPKKLTFLNCNPNTLSVVNLKVITNFKRIRH